MVGEFQFDADQVGALNRGGQGSGLPAHAAACANSRPARDRLALVVQYSGPEIIEQPLHWERDRSYILACAEREGLEVVDTLEPLQSVYKNSDLASFQRLWQMQDNNRVYGHMSAEGNRLIADLVVKNLFKHGVSDAGQ